MLNLSVKNKEGWSLKLCKSPLNGITVKLLTFNEGFFVLDMICRFTLRECRIDRQKEKKMKNGIRKERKKKEKETQRKISVFGILCKGALDVFICLCPTVARWRQSE